MKTYREALEACGVQNIKSESVFDGREIWTGEIETGRGRLGIAVGYNGAVRLMKPNGKVKWGYDKSPAQVAAMIRQTVEANA